MVQCILRRSGVLNQNNDFLLSGAVLYIQAHSPGAIVSYG